MCDGQGDHRLSLGEKKIIFSVYKSLAEDHSDLNKTCWKCAAYTGKQNLIPKWNC